MHRFAKLCFIGLAGSLISAQGVARAENSAKVSAGNVAEAQSPVLGVRIEFIPAGSNSSRKTASEVPQGKSTTQRASQTHETQLRVRQSSSEFNSAVENPKSEAGPASPSFVTYSLRLTSTQKIPWRSAQDPASRGHSEWLLDLKPVDKSIQDSTGQLAPEALLVKNLRLRLDMIRLDSGETSAQQMDVSRSQLPLRIVAESEHPVWLSLQVRSIDPKNLSDWSPRITTAQGFEAPPAAQAKSDGVEFAKFDLAPLTSAKAYRVQIAIRGSDGLMYRREEIANAPGLDWNIESGEKVEGVRYQALGWNDEVLSEWSQVSPIRIERFAAPRPEPRWLGYDPEPTRTASAAPVTPSQEAAAVIHEQQPITRQPAQTATEERVRASVRAQDRATVVAQLTPAISRETSVIIAGEAHGRLRLQWNEWADGTAKTEVQVSSQPNFRRLESQVVTTAREVLIPLKKPAEVLYWRARPVNSLNWSPSKKVRILRLP